MANADRYFRIGKGHEICQDYATCGGGERPFAVVADGCSGAMDSDLGARLIALEAARQAPHLTRESGEDFGLRVAAGAAACLPPGLDRRCLDATLVMAVLHDGAFEILLHGDGYVLASGQGGTELVRLAYRGNAPCYPSYRLNPARLGAFAAAADNGAELVRWRNGRVVEERRLGPAAVPRFSWPVEDYDLVVVASDGLGSFCNGARQPLADTEVARRVLTVKSRRGRFLARRVANGLLRGAQAEGFVNEDDLAVAGISTQEVSDESPTRR